MRTCPGVARAAMRTGEAGGVRAGLCLAICVAASLAEDVRKRARDDAAVGVPLGASRDRKSLAGSGLCASGGHKTRGSDRGQRATDTRARTWPYAKMVPLNPCNTLATSGRQLLS